MIPETICHTARLRLVAKSCCGSWKAYCLSRPHMTQRRSNPFARYLRRARAICQPSLIPSSRTCARVAGDIPRFIEVNSRRSLDTEEKPPGCVRLFHFAWTLRRVTPRDHWIPRIRHGTKLRAGGDRCGFPRLRLIPYMPSVTPTYRTQKGALSFLRSQDFTSKPGLTVVGTVRVVAPASWRAAASSRTEPSLDAGNTHDEPSIDRC